MTFGTDAIRKILNVVILACLGIACVGSLAFAIFREYLARFATSNF